MSEESEESLLWVHSLVLCAGQRVLTTRCLLNLQYGNIFRTLQSRWKYFRVLESSSDFSSQDLVCFKLHYKHCFLVMREVSLGRVVSFLLVLSVAAVSSTHLCCVKFCLRG